MIPGRKPRYYDRFRCLAGACPDSCCHQWAVEVDDASAARYRSLPGALGDILRRQLTRQEDALVLELTPEGRCPMWRQDGLCRLQAELGEEALCQTCRDFPRLTHDYGTFVERDLELSCPEAARLILTGDHTPVSCPVPGEPEEGPDPEVMELLLASRERALALLESELSLAEALAAMLLLGVRTQAALDGDQWLPEEPREAVEAARSLARAGDMAAILEFYAGLEILTDRWPRLLAHPRPGPWQEGHRKLARYFVNRYWLQAASDLDLLGRVKLVAVSCLVLRHLGGRLEETAQLYSKEIENNADNVDALLDGAYLEPALGDVKLLGLLLEP